LEEKETTENDLFLITCSPPLLQRRGDSEVRELCEDKTSNNSSNNRTTYNAKYQHTLVHDYE